MNYTFTFKPLVLRAALAVAAFSLGTGLCLAQEKAATKAEKKTEKPVDFKPAASDPLVGDWRGDGQVVAQVYASGKGTYQANLLRAFDTQSNLVATLQGTTSAAGVSFSGESSSGMIEGGRFKGTHGGTSFDLKRVTRPSPTLGASPPKGAVVLFDGRNLNAWAQKAGKDWLTEAGPARWKLVEGGAMEVVPESDCIISHEKFGDCKVHVEFRTLGPPCNSGVFLQDRYEVNINETYGRLDGVPNGGLDNCTEVKPQVRASRAPLEWQTLDIEFRAPRFSPTGKKTAKPLATVLLNGVVLYDHQELDLPHGAASRLGEAATGPLMLQEHGMPLQFRNLWLVPGTEASRAHADGSETADFKFHHPGVLVNQAQLDFVKAKIAAGAEPWKSAFETVRTNALGDLAYTPHPGAMCECGPRSNPDRGCKDEQRDSEAAYTQALLWSFTGNTAYAENAIKIMNAWARTLTGGHKLENGVVQAAWCAEVWPRAAEIIRYTYPGWAAADIAAFQKCLATQYVPSLVDGSCENGNKELSMSEALINIGVFNDDPKTFNLGVKMWRGRAPAYIYLITDGATPVKPAKCDLAIWGNKGHTAPLVDGLLQESCRDSGHANMALAGMVNAAETARQQGLDLYAEQGKRIMAALEFQAQFLPPNKATPPQYLAFNKHPTWEIAYNHFHNRLGKELPKIAAVLPGNRPTGVNHHMVWETLTHAGVGDIGLPPISSGWEASKR